MSWYSVDAVFESDPEEMPSIVSAIRDLIRVRDRVVSINAVQISDDDPRVPRRGA